MTTTIKGLGILIILLGLGLTVSTGFNLTSNKEVIATGKIENCPEDNTPINWPPLVGIALMIAGGGLYRLSENEKFTNN